MDEENPADKYRELPAEELELIAEEVLQAPLKYGDPAQAIAAMQQRVAMLNRQRAALLDCLDDAEGTRRQQLTADLTELNAHLIDAQHRLAAYQQQHEGRN